MSRASKSLCLPNGTLRAESALFVEVLPFSVGGGGGGNTKYASHISLHYIVKIGACRGQHNLANCSESFQNSSGFKSHLSCLFLVIFFFFFFFFFALNNNVPVCRVFFLKSHLKSFARCEFCTALKPNLLNFPYLVKICLC